MYRRTIAAALLAGAIAVGTAGAAVACPHDTQGRESNEAHHHGMQGHSHGNAGHPAPHGHHGAPAPHGPHGPLMGGMPLGR